MAFWAVFYVSVILRTSVCLCVSGKPVHLAAEI